MKAALFAAALFLSWTGGCKEEEEGGERVNIAAAASLRDVMPALAGAFRERTGIEVAITYGASDELVDLARGGRDIDGVLLADRQAFDRLVEAGLAAAKSVRVVAKNAIVLVSSRPSKIRFANVEELPPGSELAIGDPERVPAGRYARAHLERIGKWDAVAGRTVLAGDVAAALAEVLRGEVDFAVVYATDAEGQPRIHLLDRSRSEPRPAVLAAPLSQGTREARRFLEFIESKRGRQILTEHGFETAN